jgi:Trk K+ transport system NAD-binding subunit
MVINAPERRRIISYLISIGSGGAISAIASLVLSFTSAGEAATPRLLILAGGIAVLAVLSQSEWFNRMLTPTIKWGLRRTTSLDVRDFASLLHLRDNYGVAELEVNEGDWLAKSRLKDLNLLGEGVVVLGILRGDGSYVGAPSQEARLHPGDTLIAYGRDERLQELAGRSETDHSSHERAVEDHSNRDAVADRA